MFKQKSDAFDRQQVHTQTVFVLDQKKVFRQVYSKQSQNEGENYKEFFN